MSVIYKSIPADQMKNISINDYSIQNNTITTSTTSASPTLKYDNILKYNDNFQSIKIYPPLSTADEIKKALQDLKKAINNPDDFKSVKEIVPEKVYEFTFNDNTKIKTIREENDPFDLEYMFYLALAKKLYSKDYTFEGVLMKAAELQFIKSTVKTVKKGIQIFKKAQEEKAKKEEQEAIKKRQHEKYIRKKKEAKERKRNNQINIIAEAIKTAKGCL